MISAKGLTVIDSAFLNTNGTAPQCGIDIEPDKVAANLLQGILFKNVLVAGNKRCGVAMAPGYLLAMGSVAPIDITIDGMVIRDVPGTAYQYGRPPDHNVGGLGMNLLNSYNLSGQSQSPPYCDF